MKLREWLKKHNKGKKAKKMSKEEFIDFYCRKPKGKDENGIS